MGCKLIHMNTMLKATTVKFLDEVRERQAARAAHRQLREELATYTTPNEIADLLAAVTRFGATEDNEVRLILEQNLAARLHTSRVA
jgi:hypothetical protein